MWLVLAHRKARLAIYILFHFIALSTKFERFDQFGRMQLVIIKERIVKLYLTMFSKLSLFKNFIIRY